MLQPGESLQWLHVPRDGYGYSMWVPARFVKFVEWGQVLVDVLKADGTKFRRKISDRRLRRTADGVKVYELRREAATV